MEVATRVKFERLIRRAEEDAVINNTIRGTGAEMADDVRQGLAKLWLKEGLDSAALRGVQPETGIIAYDPLKLSSYLLEKGLVPLQSSSTLHVFFSGLPLVK